MKAKTAKKHKRKLSLKAIERMRIGGENGSRSDKVKAGKLGWQVMRKRLIEQTLSPQSRGESATD
jgi:hypothetical protein